ncbi:MAG: serine/threonine protein kinase [Planctomycetes bacterium]|nr:serine/threonine protein kinase [Planctomycetota bacterium]
MSDPDLEQDVQILLALASADPLRRETLLRELRERSSERCSRVEGLLAAFERELRDCRTKSSRGFAGELVPGLDLGQDLELEELIAAGGMGVVWRARQETMRRSVAVKISRRCLAQDGGARHADEIEAQASLSSPYIAQVYFAGTLRLGSNEHPWIAMELIDAGSGRAQSICQFMHGSTNGLRDRLQCFSKVLEGVAAIHDGGLLHRDLKPSNVLVDRHGNPKIIDFGIAHRGTRPTAPERTSGATITGTLDYIAPELLAGAEPSQRSDIYALGQMLRDLLGILVPPLEREADLARDAGAIAAIACHADPTRRYASAQDFRRDVEALLEDRPIASRRGAWLHRARLFQRRHPHGVWLAGLVVLLGVLGATWLHQSRAHLEESRRQRRLELIDSIWRELNLGEEELLDREERAAAWRSTEARNLLAQLSPEEERLPEVIVARFFLGVLVGEAEGADLLPRTRDQREIVGRALEVLFQRAMERGAPGQAIRCADLCIALADQAVLEQDKQQAEQLLRTALAFADQVDPGHVDQAKFQSHRVLCFISLGLLANERGDRGALEMLESACQLGEALTRGATAKAIDFNNTCRAFLGVAHIASGLPERDLGRVARALERASEYMRDAAARFGSTWIDEYAVTNYNELATQWRALREYERALPAVRSLVEAVDRVGEGAMPPVLEYKDRVLARFLLGDTLRCAGRATEASHELRRTRELLDAWDAVAPERDEDIEKVRAGVGF